MGADSSPGHPRSNKSSDLVPVISQVRAPEGNQPAEPKQGTPREGWLSFHEQCEINQRISSENIRKIYDIGKEIGSGRYGIVRLAKKHSHPKKRFAVKSIGRDKIKTDIHLLEQELEILKSADHPNIINFYEIYKDE